MTPADQGPSVSSVMLAALGDWHKVIQFCLMIICRYLPRCLVSVFAVYMLTVHSGSKLGSGRAGQILGHNADQVNRNAVRPGQLDDVRDVGAAVMTGRHKQASLLLDHALIAAVPRQRRSA